MKITGDFPQFHQKKYLHGLIGNDETPGQCVDLYPSYLMALQKMHRLVLPSASVYELVRQNRPAEAYPCPILIASADTPYREAAGRAEPQLALVQ